MGACEPGQARDRAAISGNFHVPGFSLKAVFFYALTFRFFRIFPFFRFSRRFPSPSPPFPIFFYRSPILPALFFTIPLFLPISLFLPPLSRFFEKFCRICEKIG